MSLIPRGKTRFYPAIAMNEVLDFDRICKNCGKSYGAHYGTDCPEHQKLIATPKAKSKCPVFLPNVEKVLLKLGVKHLILAGLKKQGSEDILNRALSSQTARKVIAIYYSSCELKTPFNERYSSSKWGRLYNLARRLDK